VAEAPSANTSGGGARAMTAAAAASASTSGRVFRADSNTLLCSFDGRATFPNAFRLSSLARCSTPFVFPLFSWVPGSRNWQVETADWNFSGFLHYFRNLLAGMWGSSLRFIETGFKNWLAAFLGFFYDFSMMSMIFL